MSKFLSVFAHSVPKIYKRNLFNCRRKQKKVYPYVVMSAKPEDYACIIDQLWQYYYPDEPTTAALGLYGTPNELFDQEVMAVLCRGLSMVAKCRYSGEIVGACINTTSCPWDPDLLDELACCIKCPSLRQYYQFYAYLQRAPCLWHKYCAMQIFELQQLYVNKTARKLGLGFRLIKASKTFGADCGYEVIRIDATSLYAIKICEKMKMINVFELPYCSYVGDGPTYEPVIKPPPPHTVCKVFVELPHYEY